jgi:hypothetical protein
MAKGQNKTLLGNIWGSHGGYKYDFSWILHRENLKSHLASWSLVDNDRFFRGAYCLHLMMEAASSSDKSVNNKPECTMLQPSRRPYSYSSLWKPQISPRFTQMTNRVTHLSPWELQNCRNVSSGDKIRRKGIGPKAKKILSPSYDHVLLFLTTADSLSLTTK